MRGTIKTTRSSLLFLAIDLCAATVAAQANAPVASIANATLDSYRGEYQHSALCTKDEITLWRCEKNQREFALCAAPVVTRSTGYLQYRASNAGKLTFFYPATKKPPLGSFTYQTSANGDAAVEFSNEGYRYSLVDPLRQGSAVVVSAPGASGKTTRIGCGGNQTLQVNYTMRLMFDSGVWDGN